MMDGQGARRGGKLYRSIAWSLAAVLLAAVGWGSSAQALGMAEYKIDGRCRAIVLSGDISGGEAQYFIPQMIAAADRCGTNVIVMQAMPGGSVTDAIAIGEVVRAREYVTAMLPNSVCASACGLIYLAGVQRYWRPNGKFVIHKPEIRSSRPFKSLAEEHQAYDDLKVRLIRYVSGMGANPDYIEAMYVVGGDNPGPKLRNLENVDLTRLGLVTMVGSPF